MKKINIIQKMIKEFGVCGGIRLLYWIMAYRTFLPTVSHGGGKKFI